MRGTSLLSIWITFLVIFSCSTSAVFGKVVFAKEIETAQPQAAPEVPEVAGLAANPSQNEIQELSQEILSELRSLDSPESEVSGRSFGFFKHKIAAIESKFQALISKILSWKINPFAPLYIDVPHQDPYSQTYYRKQDLQENYNEKPSIFSNIFKGLTGHGQHQRQDNYYNENSYYSHPHEHRISKRSAENTQGHGEVQGRTLRHVFPMLQNRINSMMNQIFGAYQYQQQNPNHFGGSSPDFYKSKLANPLEYGTQNDFDHGSSSQFHYQSLPNAILKRLGLGLSFTKPVIKNPFSDFLTRVVRKVQTPVVKQKNTDSYL